MSSNKFSRFLHLERARAEKTPPEGQVRLRDGSRFESVGAPGGEAPSSVAVPEAHVERFKRHGETPLSLNNEPAELQHFPRCVRCETENGRFASTCSTCGADLQAPEQLAYNQQRAREHAEADARLREQMQAAQKVHQESAFERRAEQRRYEAQLQLALEKDRTWLSRWQHLGEPSFGVGLLRLIRQPLARWSVLAWAIGLPVLLVRFGNEPLRLLGLYLGVLVFVLFVPTSLWRSGRRW
jgi:hypothetical protein